MSDKLKDLIKQIPPAEPKETVEDLVVRVLKRQLSRLWEKRLSFFLACLSMALGYLAIRQTARIAELLDTEGFLRLVGSQRSWVIDEPNVVWQALLEAIPFPEIGYLILLLAAFGFSVYILLKED